MWKSIGSWRCAFVLLFFLPSAGAQTLSSTKKLDTAKESSKPFVGTWHTTSGTMSIFLGIEADGGALFIWIQAGSHSYGTLRWEPLPNGLLVEGLPRFRFWKGRNANEVRVEMEPLSAEMTGPELQRFPLRFMMHRVVGNKMSKELTRRQLPDGWKKPTLPDNWDETAGKRRRYKAP